MKLKHLLYFVGSLGFLPSCTQETLEKRLETLYKETVPLVQPEELSDLIKKDSDILILDTRSQSEYEVSHIQDSRFIDFESFDPLMVAGFSKGTKVVVYCSVGYRSERIGEQMKELGFAEVYNLYGGIFNWKNQGYPVVDSHNNPTDSVHAYNRLWGKWLKSGIKVYD